MSVRNRGFGISITVFVALAALIAIPTIPYTVWSQPTAIGNKKAEQENPEERVVIHREAMRLINPQNYRVPLTLEPVNLVKLASPIGGTVRSVLRISGDKVTSQSEAVRLDDTEQALLVKRAEANLKAAEIELRLAKKQSDSDLAGLAAAKLQAADADLDLAKFHLSQTRIRVPFAGEVFRTNVVVGQIIRAGEPLFDFGDTSKLQVELPVDRKKVAVGKSIDVLIEGTAVQGTVQNIFPLAKKFEPLRELVHTVASAVVLIDNSQGRYQAGQTVQVGVIPQHYITQVSKSSLSNVSDGQRKVQVVRNGVIRDVQVRLLADLGYDLTYVTGPFATGDELIISTSKKLVDGTQVRPAGVSVKPVAANGGTQPNTPSRKPKF